MNKYIINILIILIIGLLIKFYFLTKEIETLKEQSYIEQVRLTNRLAYQDSLRKVAENKYARLAPHVKSLEDSVKTLLRDLNLKNYKINSLTQINSELNLSLQNLLAVADTVDSVLYFEKNSDSLFIKGRVILLAKQNAGLVSIDSLSTPIDISIVSVEYDENSAEIIIESKNPYLKLKKVNHYLPLKPYIPPTKKYNILMGGIYGNNIVGISVGFRYKNYYVNSYLTNNGMLWGASYAFEIFRRRH